MLTEREIKHIRGHYQRVRAKPKTAGRPCSSVHVAVRSEACQAIYEFRVALGWSRATLARLMRVTGPSIYMWEMGVREPKQLAWHSFLRVRRTYKHKLKEL